MPNFAALIGLKDDAQEGEIEGRVVALSQTESRLLEITGKDNVGDAIGVVIAAKDAQVRLSQAEKDLAEWQQTAATAEQAEKHKQITLLVDSAVATKHYGLPRDEFRRVLTDHGQTFGVEALKTQIGTYSDKVRAYQAPIPANMEAVRMSAIADFKKEHPGASTSDAITVLATEKPALFSDYAAGGR